MSRLGKKGIVIPEKVEVIINGNEVTIKGPLGELKRDFDSRISFTIIDGALDVKPVKETELTKVIWGTSAAHAKNMIEGVTKGFSKKLILEGIGYKSELKGDKLVFALGFSHPVEVQIPGNLKATVEKNNIVISGISKDDVGKFAAYLRSLKEPEPYKGKGMRYENEVIKIKQGKKAIA